MKNSLPWSQSSEQSVLGAAILDGDVLGWLELDAGHFFDPKHQAIWRALRALYERDRAVDPVTLEAELDRRRELEAVGGAAYLGDLALKVPTADNVAHYAEDLEEYRTTRETIRAATDVLARAHGTAGGAKGQLHGGELLDDALERFGKVRRGIGNERTDVATAAREFVRTLGPEVEARAKGLESATMLRTGIAAIDDVLGGLPMGIGTGIASRYGEGKSAFSFNVALNVAERGRTAAIFTNEDRRQKFVERGAARKARVDLERIAMRDLNAIELGDVMRAADELARLETLHVVHAHEWDVRAIIRHATALEADLVVVDYMQKLEAPESKMAQHEAIEANAKRLGNWAGKSGAAVLMVSQLRKGAKAENRRPTDEELRYGEGIAQESKLLMLLYNPQLPGESDTRQILVPKRNQGEKDLVIDVTFDGAHCEFR